MRFNFRFQKILDLREQQQKALELAMAGLDADVLEWEEGLRRWETLRSEILEAMREARRTNDMARNEQCLQYLRYVRRETKRCRQSLAEARQAREAGRENLVDAMKGRKAVENWRDRQHAEFVREEEKAEERAAEPHSLWKALKAEGA